MFLPALTQVVKLNIGRGKSKWKACLHPTIGGSICAPEQDPSPLVPGGAHGVWHAGRIAIACAA